MKRGRVFLIPEYAKALGYPMPESMSLGELWMARQLDPERLADLDMQNETDTYHLQLYRTAYRPAQ